ncbi:MAG: bifunctional phosphopantothenoylcysteine decarboxylase/phosphopantothenate--cysteine ligase CoaBC [Hyphomicrobiales bacterium]|jgi:phosphopantothenoylcysteine decarboxylase / phosphopantothenate---cysteine ligase|nr:bifunctional phosphopantothenoylcysteine decarboxylase/phosphopantothenate--cysteine ligase CoaBC [Hyphomicrobiales bacterium]
MNSLKNKKLLLVVGGGIAAYKSLELIRLLKNAHSELEIILTNSGKKFVTELSISQLAQSEVHTDLFDYKKELTMGHIHLSRNADLIVVAPATANLIAKLANGIADDLASTTLLAANKTIIIVPAMNPKMWHNPSTQENLNKLQKNGLLICGPAEGETACGENGFGRMQEPQEIIEYISNFFINNSRLKGKTAIVTAGPTLEPIDPVRFISNNSSGKQGYAIAATLAKYGAKTTLISGPSSQKAPDGVNIIRVRTAQEMLNAVKKRCPADIGVFAAAVADWKVKDYHQQKIKKTREDLSIDLIENINIIEEISKNNKLKPKLLIGFAAETEDIINNAQKKISKNNIDWLIANDVSEDKEVFDGDYNTVIFLTNDIIEKWKKMTKIDVAHKLSEKIIKYFQ